MKYYNLHKDIFAAPLKRSQPYCFEHLEGLAVSEATVKGWYETRKAGSSRPLHAALVRILAATKARLDDALRQTRRTGFGVRQEFRIDMSLFRALGVADSMDSLQTYSIKAFMFTVTLQIGFWSQSTTRAR